MIITTKDLIDAAQKAIDKHAAATQRYEAAQKKWLTQNANGTRNKALAIQRSVRDAFTVAIKKGVPLTEDQIVDLVPRTRGYGSSYLSDLAYKPNTESPRRFALDGVTYDAPSAIPKADLEALIELLSSVQDETISDGQLQRLGFKNLGWIFRAAVANPA